MVTLITKKDGSVGVSRKRLDLGRVMWTMFQTFTYWKNTSRFRVSRNRARYKLEWPENFECDQQMSPGTSDDKSRLDPGGGKGGGLSRLARRLSHRERRNTEERKKALRQRSVSLDCGDNRKSLMGTHLEPTIHNDSNSIPASPSLPSKLGSRQRLKSGSSSPNMAGRLSRNASGHRSKKSYKENDSEKKKRPPLNPQILFEAVELQDLDRVKEILETENVDVNSISEDDLTPLDVAVMTNNIPISKMLLASGARENPKFHQTNESRALRLITLVNKTEQRMSDFKSLVMNGSCGNANVSSSQQKENERNLEHWEFRHKLLKRMKAGYEYAKLPEVPTNVNLSVASNSSLLVTFGEPEHHNGTVVTRYRVEWSCFEDFSPLAGEQVLEDPCYTSYEIQNLVQGNVYYVRVRACNIKGFGDATIANPPYAIPSTWRELDQNQPRIEGKLQLLDDLFTNIKNSRPAHASEIKDAGTPGNSPMHPRRSNMRKSIKNLFSSAPKFQKSLKRGVYLACILCNEDKVIVTNEDQLPIIEVDENFPGTSLYSDFHWLMKIACTWEDVKSLRHDVDKSSSSINILLFRSKLLHAIVQLQSALGVQDLGQFYYQPLKDLNGSIVLTTVNYVRDPKTVSTTHVKWATASKLQKKISLPMDNLPAPELLLNTYTDMLSYQQASLTPLPKGLYLGYLKLKSSVDLIRIMVPKKLPNVLPHVKIRDCPNVTRDEWEWTRKLSMNEITSPPSPHQDNFQKDLQKACKALLTQLEISEDESVSHRVYDIEVIELSEDVSFVLLLPPIEGVCSVPGHQEELPATSNYITLPVQVFEMIHMCTYQYKFISRYSRLSSILEMDTHIAQQAQREAFSSEELCQARERVDQLSRFQVKLDETWKGMRWTMDIISYARDKSVRGGLPLGVLFAPPSSPGDSPTVERKDLDKVSSGSDAASSSCSDPGYHSDRSSVDNATENSTGSKEKPQEGTDNKCACPPQSSSEDHEEVWTPRVPVQPGILRVYAAYETGLQRGTSVKLHITPRTTSREVISLVVQQLNKAVINKGLEGPVYSDEEMLDFCLVTVIGARERVLRDDFQPLQLQNPWTKGRLYIRFKNNILAALEQGGHVTSV